MPSGSRQGAIVAPHVVSPRADDGRYSRRGHEAASRRDSLNNLHGTSDEALIARVAEGDRPAMHALYARHHVALYRFVLRLVCNAATAEDVVSDTFLAVWRQADRFEGRSGAATWMFGIARFKAYSALRRRPDEGLSDETADCHRKLDGRSGKQPAEEGHRRHHPEMPVEAFARAPRDHRSRLLPRKICRRSCRDRRHCAQHRQDANVQCAPASGDAAQGGRDQGRMISRTALKAGSDQVDAQRSVMTGLVPVIHDLLSLGRDVDGIGPRACPRSALIECRKSGRPDLR